MNYQRYQRDPREILSQRKALLQAVTVLWNNDHQELAQQLWNATITNKTRVLLPGEKR